MALKITDECINCGACEPECPNGAIYGGGDEWRISDKTTIRGNYKLKSGVDIDVDEAQPAIVNSFFYIVPDKCTECVGFNDEPQCMSVCPVDCCVPDEDRRELKDELLSKKEILHA